jgi:3-phosphoshikimate 1-carboxyvinyltransferase
MIKKIRGADRLIGEIEMPGDKSISHRALMCGAIAAGRTTILGVADCEDCARTEAAFRAMGVRISRKSGRVLVEGRGLRGLTAPKVPISAGESGTTMRLLAGILAGQRFGSVLTGEPPLLRRPMERVVEPLARMGAVISTARGGRAPLMIRPGEISPIDYRMKVASAQVKSALLFAGLYARGRTTVEEPSRSRDHTERMLRYFGARIGTKGLNVSVYGGGELVGKRVEVPGDISSASFFIVAATMLEGSRIRIKRVGLNPSRAGILKVLSRMGARYRITDRVDAFEPYGDIEVTSAKTHGVVIGAGEIPSIIDELPVLFVLASVSAGRTVISGAGELRVKETDRIASMGENIAKMGGRVGVSAGRIVIEGSQGSQGSQSSQGLRAARMRSFGDHRTAMSMAVAALFAGGTSEIEGAECVGKSFPGFFTALDSLARRGAGR